MIIIPATVLNVGYSPGSMIPAKYGAQYRVDQSAHIDITHFGSFTLQGDKPEAESKDRDKYQNRKTDIESGRFSDK